MFQKYIFFEYIRRLFLIYLGLTKLSATNGEEAVKCNHV